MDTVTIIGAIAAGITVAAGWVAAFFQARATAAAVRKMAATRRQSATLKQQLVDEAVKLTAAQAEIAALELVAKVARESGHDPNTIAWLRYTIEVLAKRDLPAAELLANAFDSGMHPNDLRDAPGTDTDSETRPTGAELPLIRRLAKLTARGTGGVEGVLREAGAQPGSGSGAEGPGSEVV